MEGIKELELDSGLIVMRGIKIGGHRERNQSDACCMKKGENFFFKN